MPKIVYSHEHLKFVPPEIYDPRQHALVSHPDDPGRIQTILSALDELSWPVLRETGDYNLDPYLSLHDSELIALYREVDRGIEGGMLEAPVLPVEFAVRGLARKPRSLDGRLGWFCTDVRTPLCKGAWAASCGSLSATIAGADLVLGDERLVYVLARPSGHCAGRDFYGGGSYINYAAGALQRLSRRARVAVLDIGFHHGSGTHSILTGFPDVPFASVHVDPAAVYPHFIGYADQRGDKKGTISNHPLDLPLDEKRFEKAVRKAVDHLGRFRPGVMIVSLGADLASQQTAGQFVEIDGVSLPISSYAAAGHLVGSLKLPTLVIQEEGYDAELAGQAVHGFLAALWETLEKR